MVRLFKGTCEAIRAMHTYRAPIGATLPNGNAGSSSSAAAKKKPQQQQQHDDDEDDDERFPQPEGDGEDGYSYGSASVPLMTRRRVEEQGDTVFDGDEELGRIQEQAQQNGGVTELVPYAHRDLKPGCAASLYSNQCLLTDPRNIMIADDGAPIVMDFGSTVKARVEITNRSQALVQQVCIFTGGLD
jgi:serine/threonine kinase 16